MDDNLNDPDYDDFHKKQKVDRSQFQEETSKTQTITKIENILKKEFETEINYKEKELVKISSRINNVQAMLDRLRAYVSASYYGSGEKIIPTPRTIDTRKRKLNNSKEKISNFNGVLPINKLYAERFEKESQKKPLTIDVGNTKENSIRQIKPELKTINRFYLNRQIIVGNVSKYLVTDTRKENDKSTHKWMVYVRGPAEEPDISHYIKSVWFFLHPSYIPNDIVQVNKPPFQITRRGWGEFPVRVQLHFKDGRTKRCDIIHNLKLDKTYTGLQTLGAETVVNLELHRHMEGNLTVVKYSEPVSCSNNLVKTVTSNENDDEHFINPLVNSTSKSNLSELSLPKTFIKSEAVDSPVMPPTGSTLSPFSSCVSSTRVSRCSSPVSKKYLWRENFISDNQDFILRKIIDSFPLIDSSKNRYHYTCKSLNIYKSWSFSKRRSSEWQRALALRDVFTEYTINFSINVKTPTTKQIMLWCRLNGYTPSENNFKVLDSKESSLNNRDLDLSYSFCELCGKFNMKSGEADHRKCKKCENFPDSLKVNFVRLPYTELIQELKQKEKVVNSLEKLKQLSDDEKTESVDIVSVSKEDARKFNNTNKLINISPTPQEDWIYETVNEIGIHLPSTTIDGTRKPVVCSMLLSAMNLFVSELLRKSHQEASINNKTTLRPGLVTVNSVYHAIKKIRKFDFLLDSHLGKLG